MGILLGTLTSPPKHHPFYGYSKKLDPSIAQWFKKQQKDNPEAVSLDRDYGQIHWAILQETKSHFSHFLWQAWGNWGL